MSTTQVTAEILLQLTDNQRRFYQAMHDHHPRLLNVWDWQKRSVDVATFDKAIKAMSNGEKIFARFLLSLWFGEDDKRSKFSLMEAANILAYSSSSSNGFLQSPQISLRPGFPHTCTRHSGQLYLWRVLGFSSRITVSVSPALH